MGKKVTIIGAGSVGSTIAYTMAVNGIATEVVMIDINESKSLGEALDIRQGISFYPPISIYAGGYPDAAGSDIVILTSGIARKPGQSRLDLAQTNVNITKSIISEITKYAQNVHAYVFGEHGDTSFVPWSLANISNIPIDQYGDYLTAKGAVVPKLVHSDVEDYIRKSGAKIIERKGATFYAVAVSVCHICKCIFTGVDTTMTVSSMMHGEYGIEDVCLSTLSTVGAGGIDGKLPVPLTDEELASLRRSADSLKNVLNSITI